MASIRTTSAGKFEASFRSKLLPKPHYATFDDETQARQYAVWLDGLLAKGVVPAELAESYQDRRHDPLLLALTHLPQRQWVGAPVVTQWCAWPQTLGLLEGG